ncbi:PREDICTED: probable helicase MAGATAMA 3 isoform X2 [Prunus mume]|uniref:Probable helicase MAGATAMA 3 isoform X2 n=1 Tax=Prunus mume TaxID=102107 RepID=A0ABM0N352_PRUMU|nr:PREDICTED: probable helicase MAGATAMA 3 isoform X2 [Prunus mume]
MAVDKDKLQEAAPIARFHKIVLGWDYYGLLTELTKNEKKNKKKNKGEIDDGLGMGKVKDTYKDVDDYISTYEPLLFEEVKAQIIQSKDENQLLNPKRNLVVACTEVDGFHLATLTYEKSDMDDKEAISQNDLLLLLKPNHQDKEELPTVYAFALVESRQASSFRIRMYLAGEAKNLKTDAVETCPRLLNLKSLVTSSIEGERFFVTRKICSLSTIAREYVALWSIGSLPFKDIILGAAEKNIDSEGQAWKISRPLEEFIKDNLNESQQNAIQAGLSRKPFILIQGPPGTGKTQTILGLLSAILHATPARVHSSGSQTIKLRQKLTVQEKFHHWRLASPWLSGSNPREEIMPVNGDDGFFPTTGNELKPEVVNSSRKYRVRVLVCAPSNSALDEIVLRVLNSGVRDESDRSYNPKIVRIGLKAHHSVQAVSMDEMVERKKGSMGGSKDRDGGADRFRAEILEEAVIVFSTLSFSGSPLFSKYNRGFDVVIIDEAAQAVEPAILVPLTNGCKQVFLIGDPVQLPATVISPIAAEFGYGMSLFERFQRAGYPVTMLKMQYRMHPEIRSFPSREFYSESLEDGPNIKEQTKRSWHDYRCFGPFCFFDLHEAKESEDSGSKSNDAEVEFVMLLYNKLVSKYPELKSSHQFAIISPYAAQVNLLKERFKSTFGVQSEKVVDITTVDGCQGREKDVAIFSCVRASEKGAIGFLADFRRMNVGITRAKSSILVVGSASTLRKGDEHWNNLVESAEKRDSVFKVSKPYASFFSDENLESMAIKKESSMEEVQNDELDNDPGSYNLGDADQAQGDDNDYGDGDGDGEADMGDGGDD